MKIRFASGAGGTFGVDDIAIAHAASAGFWEREGLEVEWTPVRGGVKAAEAVLSDEVDVGYGTWVPCVTKRLDGQPIKILASMAQALAQNLIVNKKKITCPDDLRGKKWAVDGIGALSHTLAQLIVRGLGIPDNEVEWVLSGPPPQRIAALLDGSADCSLVRVEEAAVLARQHPDLLAKLFGFEEIFPLAPVQPHGVISVTESFAQKHPDACAKLVRGLVLASRSLHDSLSAFREAVRVNVTERKESIGPKVAVNDEEVKMIWEREVEAGSFAVNGGLSVAHWSKNMAMYGSLHGGRGADLTLQDISLPGMFVGTLFGLGKHHAAAHDVPDADGAFWSSGLGKLAEERKAKRAKFNWPETPAGAAKRMLGKVCIVAGAGQTPGQTVGNGRAVALMFAREGARLMLADRSMEAVKDTQLQCKEEFGVEAEIMVTDVAKEADCEALIAATVARYGRVDVLHNNVGIAGGDKGPADIDDDVYTNIMRVNAGGALWLTKHALPVMRKQLAGHIIQVSSIGSINTLPQGGGGGTAYKMAKAAMNNLVENVAIENARYGIRCNAILPGLMETPMSVERRTKVLCEAEGLSDEQARQKVRDARNKQVPLRIGGQPSMGHAWDTGNAALWLASEEARFVTGVLLCVDGGQTVSKGCPVPDRERDC
jgi:NAD(P)-dependent dehydrogenase (short-subunit alcohol dehydrogenase family)/ABC-type nitrate/sulfonate/bicarbonate transport system substrate-binding protein